MNAKTYNMALLAAIVAATNESQFGMFTDNDELTALVNDGYVATNPNMKDGGNIAAMATDTGKALNAQGDNGNADAGDKPAKEKQTFAVATMKRPEQVKRQRESTGSKYPFDDLAAPDGDNVSSFFVPATEDMPDPAKSLTSAVSQANRTYGKIVGKNERGHNKYQYTRVFRIQASDDPKGAYVWRDADAKEGDTEDHDDNAPEGGENSAQA